MIDTVQTAIEDLADRLHRSVAVDDAALRLVAASTHFEEADPARLGSLVDRVVAGEAREYLLRAGIMSWQGVHRTSPDATAGSKHARVCFPLRSRYELLGFMTIIEDDPLTDEEMAAAEQTARELQNVMASHAQAVADRELELEPLVHSLLSPAIADRSRAARSLADLGVFRGSKHFCSIVVSIAHDWDSSDDGPARDLVRRALRHATAGLVSASYAYTASDTESYLVAGYRIQPAADELRRVANLVHHEITKLSPWLTEASVIGVGLPQEELTSLPVSLDQARHAIRIGRSQATAVNTWADAPVDSLLSVLLVPEYSSQLLPEVLRTLNGEPQETLRLLETFLDNACNVVDTAEQLHLHRTTIYYRLKRIQTLTGLNLASGHDRLMVHLWLKSKAYSMPT